MQDRNMRRSWTIAALSATAGAAALAFALFLAVGRETVAGDKVTVVTPDHDHVSVYKLVGSDDDSADSKFGYLGVEVREDTKSNEGGALVEAVVDDSPAAKAGLREGDVIVGFSGDVVRGPGKLTEKIHATKPGDSVSLDIRRDGKSQKLNVTMGSRPAMAWSWHSGDGDDTMTDAQRQQLEESLRHLDQTMPKIRERLGRMKIGGPGGYRVMVLGDKPLLGVELVHTTPELRESMGGRKDAGVLVGKVLSGSAAEKAGVKVGDLILSIDGKAVSDPGELGDAIQEREGKTVDVELVRDKRTMHLKATLPESEEPEDEVTGPRAWMWRAAPVAPTPAIPPVPPPAAAPPAPPAPPAFPAALLFV